MNPASLSRSDSGELELAERQRPLKILLAEDNPRLRRILGFILRRDGHEVVEPEGESQFLEIIATVSVPCSSPPGFDLVISEHGLPGILGLSVLAGVRVRNRALRFILIAEDPRVQMEARRLGAVALSPPPTVGSLRGAIAQAQAPTPGLTIGRVAVARTHPRTNPWPEPELANVG